MCVGGERRTLGYQVTGVLRRDVMKYVEHRDGAFPVVGLLSRVFGVLMVFTKKRKGV